MSGTELSRALALHRQGAAAGAEPLYRAVLARQPDQPDALYLLGVLLLDGGQAAAALGLLERAAAVRPGWGEALHQQGRALLALARPAEALAMLDGALAKRPALADAEYRRGLALARLGRQGAAVAAFDRLLALRPEHAPGWFERGLALALLEQPEAAIASFDRTLALRPDHAPAWMDRGIALAGVQRVAEALASHERAAALRPEDPRMRLNRGLARLLAGDFPGGFADCEARWAAGLPGLSALPPWRGEAGVAGRRVLVEAEQGFGDTLQFCRYVPLLAGLGAAVVLRVQAPLVALLRGLAGAAEVIAERDAAPDCMLACPMLSLPLAFGTALGKVPAAVPYLAAPADRAAAWRARLGPRVRPRVGLAWSGNPRNANNHHRSMPAALLAPLLALDAEFHGLQPEVPDSDAAWLAAEPRIRQHGLADFADTAALVAQLDAVVSVDTAVAHLAGAMARPLLVPLAFHGVDWRWQTEREDSPWYPTARLFRRGREEGWEPVVGRMAAALRARLYAPC